MEKICTKCLVKQDINNFSNKKSNKDGKANYCKSCVKQKNILNRDKAHLYYIIKKENNPDYSKEQYIKNKDKKIQYRIDNREKYIPYFREYYIKNKSERRKKMKEYYNLNKEKGNKRNRNRYINEPLFKLNILIRTNIRRALKSNNLIKNKSTHIILGCSIDEFKNYIESLFEPWMNWGNQGNPKDKILEFNKTWDLDHIIPLDSAKTEEDIYRLNCYTNFRPLCSKVNREVKRNLLDF